MRHHYAPPDGLDRVDGIICHALARDHFEIWQSSHHLGWHTRMAACDHTGDGGTVFVQPCHVVISPDMQGALPPPYACAWRR